MGLMVVDGVVWYGGWCLPKKADRGSETDSWWPMEVDGTNTVTGEDCWHRVVTSTEPARAVTPTAFFVCFVKAVLQTQNMPLVTKPLTQQRQKLCRLCSYFNCSFCVFCQSYFANKKRGATETNTQSTQTQDKDNH